VSRALREPFLSYSGTPKGRGALGPDRRDAIQLKSNHVRALTRSLRLVEERGELASVPRPQSDAELVHALRADGVRAPAILWDRYAPLVRRLLLRTLGSCLEIEDLTQEIFMRIFMRLSSLRDPSALRPFVLSVAANVLKWELRRRWIGRRVFLSATGTLPDVEGVSDDAEARHALRRCYLVLEELSTKERLAFVFRYMEGMTIREVATALDVSVSTAKRWVNRAAAKVAEHVSQDADLRSFFVDSGKDGQHEP
jgi:RNA polymerase sigma-70 factor, ECF subfamily